MLIKEICNQQTTNYKFQEISEHFLNTSVTQKIEIRPLNVFVLNYAALKKVRVKFICNLITFFLISGSTGCCECFIYFHTTHPTLF